jgi:hypothetical protein
MALSLTISPQSIVSWLSFHIYSLWLFTLSDLKTIVFPQTVFGILSALSQVGSGVALSNSEEHLSIIRRTPLVLCWVWINFFPFAINNQRHPQSIAEDALNKPWRTLPSKRWSSYQATCAMFLLYLGASVVSWQIGGYRWSMSLLILGK